MQNDQHKFGNKRGSYPGQEEQPQNFNIIDNMEMYIRA